MCLILTSFLLSKLKESFREKCCAEGSDLHLLFDDLLDGISVKSRKDGATPPKTTWEECVGQFNNLLDSFPIEHSSEATDIDR